jgi:hypothetical protein
MVEEALEHDGDGGAIAHQFSQTQPEGQPEM